MSWLLQWVMPNFIERTDDLFNEDSTMSIEQLRNLSNGHSSEIKRIYLWVHIDSQFTKRQIVDLETSWTEYIEKFVEKEVVIFPIKRLKKSTMDDFMIDVARIMHGLCIQEPFDEVVLLSRLQHISLQQAVLIEGIKTFEDRFCLLLQDKQGQTVIQQFNESPYQQSWLKLLQQFLHEYDYVGALKLFEGIELNDETRFIKLLLRVQHARINFDFNDALSKLQEAKSFSSFNVRMKDTEHILKNLTGACGEQQMELEQIQELYRHIKVLLLKDDLPSFLIRFYRAREAVLSYIVKYGAKENIDIHRYSSIYKLIEQVEALFEDEKINRFFGVYFYIKSSNVANTLIVRNKSFIGHNRKPISRNAIFEEYYGAKKFKNSQAMDRFLGDTRIMLRDLGGTMDDNLELMNTYIIEAIVSAAREGAIKVD